MRISALSSLLVIGVLAAPARADRNAPARSTAAVASTRKVASLAAPVRGELPGTPSTPGDLRLTGAARPARTQPFLEAREVAAAVHPYAPEIERCYLERLGDVRRAGRLELTFVIGREGDVVSLAAAAPSLPAKTARQVESCVRDAVSALHFPERRNDTTAIVPYYFQHTNAPGAGPKLSCWNSGAADRRFAASARSIRARSRPLASPAVAIGARQIGYHHSRCPVRRE